MSKLVKAPGLGYIRGVTNGEEVKLNNDKLKDKNNKPLLFNHPDTYSIVVDSKLLKGTRVCVDK